MVVTRSGRSRTSLQVAPESSQQKSSAPKGVQRRPESRKESRYNDRSTAESQPTGKQSSRKSEATDSLVDLKESLADGETSDLESSCSSVLEVQEPILRITRSRQILITPTPQSSVRKSKKITPVNESLDEAVSEAESYASGISRIALSTEITRSRRNKAKSQRDESQETHAEAVSDAESCSDILSYGIAPRRTARNVRRKLEAEVKKKYAKIIPGDKKQTEDASMNSEDSDPRQTSQLPARSPSQINKPDFCNNETYIDFGSLHSNSGKIFKVQNHQHLHMQEDKQASVASHTEIRKNRKSLDKEDIKIIEEKEINENDSQLSLSELQDTCLQQSVSQTHSTPPNNKAIPRASSPNCEAIMKSLALTFAVVKMDRWNGEKKSTIKMSDLTPFGDHGNDESTSVDVSEDRNSQDSILECDTELPKSELSMSQNLDSSVLLVLSSDESQQSENSECEEDTIRFVESSDQKESLNGDSGNTSCDTLFVIDRTPGLSADKSFYLEDKASKVAAEEEKEIAAEEEKEEEEDENSEEESSDSDKNKDESSDEEDLLNNTKSKLLKLTSSTIDPGLNIKQLGGLYINFNADKLQSHKKTVTQIKEKKKDELLQKAIITPDFEKNYCVPPYSESKHQLQKKRRKERQKTAGNGWFGMKAPELTDELKNDLKALKMRASMDPKRFYKKNDRDGFPKYFQVGTIVDNPADFYHSRIPKKQRKKTLVEELLADSEFRRFNRRKYSEIMAEKAANAAGKRFRKKKKFRN
uniref:Deoxynucleotidyltransferase, terminal, interacting protein 2 n=1 Tax=Nannospalax galili TaxID=1026970 RepID=A0A8C6QR25_NANGA